MRYFLTGLPGSGKTHLGKIWATDNRLDFYDLDSLIEDEERMSVAAIFENRGEDYFREKEAAVLRNTDRFEHCIIACGGGTPCFYDNLDWMSRNGKTVWLNETLENICYHFSNDKKMRPLFPTDEEALHAYIDKLMNDRKEFYSKADVMLNEENLNRQGFDFVLKNIEKDA